MLLSIGILRSHYKEKDSRSTFTDLQWMRHVLILLQDWYVLSPANEKDCPHDKNLLQRRFLKASETGIRNGNVRNEIRPLLKNLIINDKEFLERLTFASRNELERSERFWNKKKSDTSIFSIDKQHQKDNPLHLQIQKLKLDHQKQIESVCFEMKECTSATNWNAHTHIKCSISSFLEQYRTRAPFPQNRQPMHFMNPFSPRWNPPGRGEGAYRTKMFSPQRIKK